MNEFAITTSDGCRLAYRFDGRADNPVLLLSNSIGTDLTMWDPQIEALGKHFRVLRYDSRGHGSSDVPAAPYSVDRLGRDVIELLDALRLSRVHFLGLSLGGMVGQWLGMHAPERIDRLILANTSAYLGPADQWEERIASALRADRQATADMFLRNWFPSQLLEAGGPMIAKIRAVLLATDPQGFAGSYAAVRDMDMRRTIALISAPTLVIAGQHDTVTLPSHSELIAATVLGAKLVVLPVVHLSNLEAPDAFMNAVLGFLLLGESKTQPRMDTNERE
ncbi:MAG: 3-oxoadipate enol-lactonase [Verrucomicrobia bacterium]|nr:3-oxoadipate enol-lactonase [Verrucomicrobiota bacterium]